jgi:hypothetical protein
MLAIDFLELLGRRLGILALVHQIQALIVELVRGLFLEGVVLGTELVENIAGAASAKRQREHGKAGSQPHVPSQPGCLAQFERHTLCRHEFKNLTPVMWCPCTRHEQVMDATPTCPWCVMMRPRALSNRKRPLNQPNT